MKDCKDQEIEVGDTVAVAGRQGSSSWIDTFEVVGTQWTTKGWRTVQVELPVLARTRSYSSWKTGECVTTTKKVFLPYKGRQSAILVIKKAPSQDQAKVETVEGERYGIDGSGEYYTVDASGNHKPW